MSVKIHGEYIARIVHCLIVNQGVDVKMIRKVYSHPQALGQCRQFLEAHHWEAVATYDTAGSVKIVKEQALMDAAAIASERAAELYQMRILQQGIETDQQNYTRFFILAQGRALQTGEDKTSLIFTLKHAPGTLVKALKVFATRRINLTKIESRPIVGKPWEYHFYVDCEGHVQEQPMQEAIKELRRYARTIKILGSYPRAPKSNL